MRKRPISSREQHAPDDWLDVSQLATVEVSSEDPEQPIERALVPGNEGGWRAAVPGPQTIRILFDEPQRIRRIRLVFAAGEQRTQEFLLGWSGGSAPSFHEIVRQQWNFSPEGGTREVEDYVVDLSGVTALELHIRPDISGGNAVASVEQYLIG